MSCVSGEGGFLVRGRRLTGGICRLSITFHPVMTFHVMKIQQKRNMMLVADTIIVNHIIQIISIKYILIVGWRSSHCSERSRCTAVQVVIKKVFGDQNCQNCQVITMTPGDENGHWTIAASDKNDILKVSRWDWWQWWQWWQRYMNYMYQAQGGTGLYCQGREQFWADSSEVRNLKMFWWQPQKYKSMLFAITKTK